MFQVLSVVIIIIIVLMALKIVFNLFIISVTLLYYIGSLCLIGFIGYYLYGKFIEKRENQATKIVEDLLGKKNEKNNT